MKRIIVALVVIMAAGFVTALAQPLDSTARFRRGSDRYYKNGALRQCELIGVMDLQGYSCQGRVWFHDNGCLGEFQLAESASVRGIGFPARTWVSLNEDGMLDYVFLPHTMVIQGVPCAGNRMGREGIMTAFHPNSNLRECFLAFPATIRNVPLHAGAFSPVELYEDGSLKSGWLAQSYEADGTVHGKNTRLTFSEEGMVIEARHRSWLSQAWTDLLDVIF
jgi:hypothetical protein